MKSDLPLWINTSDWLNISSQFHEQLNQLKHTDDESKRLRLSASLVSMLIPYPNVYKQLKLTMEMEYKRQNLVGVQHKIIPNLNL